MCANEYVYLGKLCAQMNHILSKMCANLLPPLELLTDKQDYWSYYFLTFGLKFESSFKLIHDNIAG